MAKQFADLTTSMAWLAALPPPIAGGLCALAAAGAAVGDYATGPVLNPVSFYLIPVVCSAWTTPPLYGVVTTAGAAVALIVVKFVSSPHNGAELFNASTDIALLITLYISIHRVRFQLKALERANYGLERANQEKAALFRIISHDLTSPFNAVLGYAHLLEERTHTSPEDPQLAKYAAECKNAATAAYRLLQHLLEWAKLQLHSAEPTISAINAAELIESSVTPFRSVASLKSVSLEIAPIDTSLSIAGDRSILQTVLRNLIDNAIKFTPSQGRIQLLARRHKSAVEICISDSGVGIEPKKIDSLFHYTAGSSSPGTNGEVGSGLGLPLCRELLEKTSGTINVRSTLGSGTAFFIVVPGS